MSAIAQKIRNSSHRTAFSYYKRIAKISFPILAQSVTIPIALTIDTSIVGHLLGTVALAGLSIGNVIIDTIVGIGVFVIFTSNATIAQHQGSRNEKKTVHAIINTLALALLLGVIITILGYSLLKPATSAFDVTPEVRKVAQDFMTGWMMCFPVIVVSMACTGILRGLRMYKVPTIAAISGIAVNVPLVLTFIMVMDMGILGTGIGGAIATYVECSVKVFFVIRYLRRSKHFVRPSLDGIGERFKDGAPVLLRSIVLWTTNLFMIYSFGVLGTEAVAGIQVADALWIYLIFIVDSLSQAMGTLIGEQIGKRDFAEADNVLRYAVRLSQIYAGVLFLFCAVTAWFIPYLFTSDPIVIMFAIGGTIEGAFALFHLSYSIVMDGALIGAGDTKFLAFSAAVCTAIYIGSGYIAISLVPHNLVGFIIILATYDGVFMGLRALLGKYRHNKGRWLIHAQKQAPPLQ